MVVGAGIGGMEFALRAQERGHKVTVYEKSGRLGGLYNEAAGFSYKGKARKLLAYYANQVKKENIDIRLNTEIKDLSEHNADEIVVATGTYAPIKLKLPGSERFITAQDFIKNKLESGENVVVIGGGVTGCEIAYELALMGKKPVIVEMQDDILIAPGSCMANTSFLRDAFEYYKVPVYISTKVVSADEKSVKMIVEDGSEICIPADSVVQAVGFIEGLPFELPEDSSHVHLIGDARKFSNLMNAIHNAYDLAKRL